LGLGLIATTFNVTGTGGATGIATHYYQGTTNITADVRAGTYDTATVAARANIILRVVVRP
jgi:hypothetical protein